VEVEGDPLVSKRSAFEMECLGSQPPTALYAFATVVVGCSWPSVQIKLRSAVKSRVVPAFLLDASV
jgi:hypothetical protein